MAADPEQRRALDFVDLVGGADDLEEARQHADADAETLDDPDHVEQAQVGVARPRRDQSAVYGVLLEQALERVEGPQAGKLVDACVARVERDPPDHVGARVAALQLGRQPMGRLGVAEDHAAFLGDQQLGQAPGADPRDQHQEEQEAPEDHRLLTPEGPLDDRPAGQEGQQRVEGGDEEQGGRLVEGRLVDDVLVAVVEARELADRDHHRDRDDRPEPEVVAAGDRDRDREGGRRGDQVGDGEQAAIDGVARRRRLRRLPLVEVPGLLGPVRSEPRAIRLGAQLAASFGGDPSRLDRARAVSTASKILPKGV